MLTEEALISYQADCLFETYPIPYPSKRKLLMLCRPSLRGLPVPFMIASREKKNTDIALARHICLGHGLPCHNSDGLNRNMIRIKFIGHKGLLLHSAHRKLPKNSKIVWYPFR